MLFNTQGKLDLFLDVLAQSKYGSICVYKDNKSIFSFKGELPGPDTNIKILKDKCISDFFLTGDLGWAESYIEGNWNTPNLTNFLEWGAKNFHEFSKFIRGKWHIILYLRIKHFFNRNTKNGSQKNIKFLYDLGNNFYQSWLDKSMTYSSAIFRNKEDNLYNAQINKSTTSTDNVAGQLKVLKEMYDSGDLTKEEYVKAKKKVLE